MNKEEFLKAIENVPKIDSINPISAYNSINVEDLANAVDRFKKVPTYDELTKENQKLKKHQKEFIKYLESKINKIRLNSNTTTLHTYSKKIIPYIEILSKYKEIIKSDK